MKPLISLFVFAHSGFNPLFNLAPFEPPRSANLEARYLALGGETVGSLLRQLQIRGNFPDGHDIGVHVVPMEANPYEKIRENSGIRNASVMSAAIFPILLARGGLISLASSGAIHRPHLRFGAMV